MNKKKMASELVKLAKELSAASLNDFADAITMYFIGDSKKASDTLKNLSTKTKDVLPDDGSSDWDDKWDNLYAEVYADFAKVLKKHSLI
jgi:16S rRNA A1518/A1519 N6-dimethyltransferase RsmA/KsgA/DIM1 with predicted DNA glycosylase/AP lyase activity